jgi:hypothetical protein
MGNRGVDPGDIVALAVVLDRFDQVLPEGELVGQVKPVTAVWLRW